MAISHKGIFKPIFVEPGVKINANYYINKVLKPFLKEIVNFYPDNNYIFHQDSATYHTSKETQEFLRKK